MKYHLRNIAFFTFAFILTIYGNTYIVGENGDFNSIQDAINVAFAGDTILVREKSQPYFEAIGFIRSGNENDGYIVLSAYPGEHPVIDGTGINFGSDWIIGMVKIINKSYVEISGFEIRNLITDNADKFPAGIWVRGNSHHVKILNNKIHDIKHLNADAGAHGIAVYGTNASGSINNLIIEGNEIYNCVLAWSESLVLNGNVEEFIVKNNVVHDNDNIGFDFIGYEGTCPNEEFDMARNGIVSDNIAYNIDSRTNPAYGGEGSADGFYVDGGKDIIFERNLAYNCNIGFELASEHNNRSTENITVRNNFILNNHYVGIAIGGYDSQRGSTIDCKIINNTFYKNGTENDWGAEFYIQYYCVDNLFKNNIIYTSGNVPLIYYSNTTGNGFEINHNLYFSSGEHYWIWEGNNFSEFSQYAEFSGNDANSIYSDPAFDLSSLQNNIPELTANSPAINSGENLSVDFIGEIDFCGNPRVVGNSVDIGACEYQNTSSVNENSLPSGFVLFPAYPNPFNPETVIEYIVPQSRTNVTSHFIQLKIYDLLGKEVATLVNEKQIPGKYKIRFNAKDSPSGIYYCVLKSNKTIKIRKLILLK